MVFTEDFLVFKDYYYIPIFQLLLIIGNLLFITYYLLYYDASLGLLQH